MELNFTDSKYSETADGNTIISYTGCLKSSMNGYFTGTLNLETGVHELILDDIKDAANRFKIDMAKFADMFMKRCKHEDGYYHTSVNDYYECELTEDGKIRFRTQVPSYVRDMFDETQETLENYDKKKISYYSDGVYFGTSDDDNVICLDIESRVTEDFVVNALGNILTLATVSTD